ncbi:MAG: hypothetical protein ABW061_03200 [Polyangiaceae bacterium]
MRCRGSVSVLIGCLLCHCSLGPSASEKTEAGLITRAIDVLRDAPNAQKGELLDGLKSANCAAPDLCELQRVCVDGYGQHVAALSETERAKTLLTTGGDPAEASRTLDYARSELAEAAPKIAHCADAEGAARRKYKP